MKNEKMKKMKKCKEQQSPLKIYGKKKKKRPALASLRKPRP